MLIGLYEPSFDWVKFNTIGFYIYIGSNSNIIGFHCHSLKLAQNIYLGFEFISSYSIKYILLARKKIYIHY